ncbi:MAG TPA: thiamine phosphate synthase [Cycloclasticus sp.]|jgi:thiamine-phosphate pyrophosphorylase|nr:thiamine phosphate synthase [Cycloclasticus sp.]
MKNKFPSKGLYAITPNGLDANTLYAKVEQALQGGIALLQYRDKTNAAEEKLQRANHLHTLCLKYSVPLIINDDPDLALACKAEGVHLGQVDGSVQKARVLLGDSAIIGVTCHHDISLAVTAQQQGADYVAFGRFYNSNTKPGAPLATTELLTQAKTELSIPTVAIGGINHINAQALVNMGADYIAVIEKIFLANDIKNSCQRFNHLFEA